MMPSSLSPFPPSTPYLPIQRDTPEGQAQSADCWVFSLLLYTPEYVLIPQFAYFAFEKAKVNFPKNNKINIFF